MISGGRDALDKSSVLSTCMLSGLFSRQQRAGCLGMNRTAKRSRSRSFWKALGKGMYNTGRIAKPRRALGKKHDVVGI